MRNTIVILTILVLAGCAGFPPKPPSVEGEYRPVNQLNTKHQENHKTATPPVFDFIYEGDIINALPELQKVQPQLTVLAPLGNQIQLPVRFNLQATTLENALRSIDEQGGGVADVISSTAQQEGGNQIFIRFHPPYPYQKPAAKRNRKPSRNRKTS
jgi:hypothetical protein